MKIARTQTIVRTKSVKKKKTRSSELLSVFPFSTMKTTNREDDGGGGGERTYEKRIAA